VKKKKKAAPEIKYDPTITNGAFYLARFYAAFRGTIRQYLSQWEGRVVTADMKENLVVALSKLTPCNVPHPLHAAVYFGIFTKGGKLRAKTRKRKPGNCLKEHDETFLLLKEYCDKEIVVRGPSCRLNLVRVEEVIEAVYYGRVVCGTPPRFIAHPPGEGNPPLGPVHGGQQLWSMYGNWTKKTCTDPNQKRYDPKKFEQIGYQHGFSVGLHRGNIAPLKPLGEISLENPLTPARIQKHFNATPFNSLVIASDVAVLISERLVQITWDDITKRGGGAHLGTGAYFDFNKVHTRLKTSPAFLRDIGVRSFPLHKLGHLVCEIRQWVNYKPDEMVAVLEALGSLKRFPSEECPANQCEERMGMYRSLVDYYVG